jgi:hypothetical protein
MHNMAGTHVPWLLSSLSLFEGFLVDLRLINSVSLMDLFLGGTKEDSLQ